MSSHHLPTQQHLVDTQTPLTLKEAYKAAAHPDTHLSVSARAMAQIKQCRQYLAHKIEHSDHAFYGINTGFGLLCNVRIDKDKLSELQHNLLLSHAVGCGRSIPRPIVRLMLLLKIRSLSYGHSGVPEATVQRLVDFFNHNILPVVYEQGSLGASGDLAPLAHLCLPLIGLGEVWHDSNRRSAAEVLAEKGWQPLLLGPKEGLALINGTQFMSAFGVWCGQKAKELMRWANLIAAVNIDAYQALTLPFMPLLHSVRPHKGQIKTAKQVLKFLAGSALADLPKTQVQDCYSFRCIPQVHGASYEAIQYACSVITQEINSVTDNPLIFEQEDIIVSGGHFHGQPLALALDFLAIALAELGSISERRIYKILDGTRGLPVFLTEDSGLHSGMMMLQYTAAALVSQNKQYCTPASVDSIPSSNGQEDHVSMGANAAVKCYMVLENVMQILAIELICAAQALEMRKQKCSNLPSSPIIEDLLTKFRQVVPYLSDDRYLHKDMLEATCFLHRNKI